ncbi:outer membrane beta-barrel protein [Catenovulum maritimum]|uniref:Outer membrane protein beta-barrel domain-containing protein n=1 Tax=Catenovulum maritimum TaxID=1513271 RepID=A0A0J8JMG2_9ALTE|nr:outer membrane beta-barrel protein [Catenovulum maritimum]KMT65801.1 hypothetical protein XM47_07320 [Catenovulum maritimum]
MKYFVILFLFSGFANADNRLHQLGLEYTIGSIGDDASEQLSDLNDVLTMHIAFNYQYELHDYVSIGVGHLSGDSSNGDIFFWEGLLTDSRLEYKASYFFAEGRTVLSKRNRFYARLKALSYDYDVIDDEEVKYQEDGSDIGYSIGWMLHTDSGLTFNVGWEKSNLGKHVSIQGFNLGLGYRF